MHCQTFLPGKGLCTRYLYAKESSKVMLILDNIVSPHAFPYLHCYVFTVKYFLNNSITTVPYLQSSLHNCIVIPTYSIGHKKATW